MSRNIEAIIEGERNPIRKGWMAIGLLGAFFVGFGIFAELSTATVAPGVVEADSSRKTIQHLEGGIIQSILVRDGDKVEADQPLVQLDRTQAAARLQLVKSRLNAARAEMIRLIAERDGAEAPDFTGLSRVDDSWQETITGQQNVFNSRRQTLQAQEDVLSQQILDLQTQITGLRGQARSDQDQINLLDAEIKDVEELIEKGLARRPRLLALQRRKAEITGQKSQYDADIARASQSIGETKLRIGELRSTFQTEVVERISEVQEVIFDFSERVRAAEDVLLRTTIRAPLAGTVVNLQYFTTEGVISPGSEILEIVPKNDLLIVDALVNPNDIDIVRPGLQAKVRFTAVSQRNTVPAAGVITEVSADRLIDERTGEAYFKARVRLDSNLDEALGDVELYPGMQTEVIIVTGKTTLFSYLFDPLMQSFRRSLRT